MKDPHRRTIGYVTGTHGCITPSGSPFFQVRLDAAALENLVPMLDQAGRAGERRWHLLAATQGVPSRLRLYQIPTPDFEQHAYEGYARGKIYRISGRKSMNLAFSVHGASLIAERLREARQYMRRFVLFRVPGRKIDLIEFVPDKELERIASEETAQFGEVGAKLASHVWEPEDFNDWEQPS